MADHDTWKALHRLTNLTTKLILNSHLDHVDNLEDLSDEDLRRYLNEAKEDMKQKRQPFLLLEKEMKYRRAEEFNEDFEHYLIAEKVYNKYWQEYLHRMLRKNPPIPAERPESHLAHQTRHYK